MAIRPFSTTGIGSLPYTDPQEACSFVIQCFDMPFWPQLPRVSFKESMTAQFSEGMPYLKIDEARQSVSIIRDKGDDLDRFYEGWTEGTRISISSDFASGIHAFLKVTRLKSFDFLKGHITGPLTYTLSLKDGSGRLIYFDEELREIALMVLKSKILWQYDILKPLAQNLLFFIDEPVFTAIGSSAFMGVDDAEVKRMLSEIIGVIKGKGALSCIHCCGKADWQMVIDCGPDMLSFDAFEYFDTFNLYSMQIAKFLEAGGYLAWGIVPTSDKIAEVSYNDVFTHLRENISTLSKAINKDILISRSILTPSCGAGSRTIDETVKIAQILMRLKEDITSIG